jgi:hypothetical protein
MRPLWTPAQPQSEQRQLIPPSSFFLFLLRLFGKNYLVRIAFGATVESPGYESRVHGFSRDWQPGGFVLAELNLSYPVK